MTAPSNAAAADVRSRSTPATPRGDPCTNPPTTSRPRRLFVRRWALALLAGVLDDLRGEYTGAGKAELFDALKATLTGDPRSAPYAEIAGQLGMTEGAVQVAVHRLRRRYRAAIRARIAATVADPGDIEGEIRDLFAALGS